MATRVTRKQSGDHVIYLYGISKAVAGPKKPLSIFGVDGEAPVERLTVAGLACWISRVSKSEFADKLVSNMQNLDWLAKVSVNHQRVVSAIAQKTSILPTRFGTVFLQERTLKNYVANDKRSLQKELMRINGMDEWGIKVFAIRPAIPKTVAAKSGKDYLRAKAAQLQSRNSRLEGPELEGFLTALGNLAKEIAEGGAVTAAQPGLEWHGSVLLRRRARGRFTNLMGRLSRAWHGVHRIECTGPWPPYSFVHRIEANGEGANRKETDAR